MAAVHLTDHARGRMQQRGISAEALDALLDFGREQHVDRGLDIVFFDKKAKKRLAQLDAKHARAVERLVRTYAILGTNGIVVTVGHRHRRIRRI